MSHAREREEKNCLNCGTIVHGRYCQACGQENVEPKESFWTMLVHFFNDITHFDGKFFITLKDLLFRPGFLSAEYMKGRRASYLHPIRMYIFTSAIFFLIFFSIFQPKIAVDWDEDDLPYTLQQRDSIRLRLENQLVKDSQNTGLRAQMALLSDTSRDVRFTDLVKNDKDYVTVGTFGRNYSSRREYDSIQQSLPAGDRDGWLKRLWNKRASSANDRYRRDTSFSVQSLAESVLHKLPYLLFVSLPIFALLLKLLYIRRKDYYYADHGIFSVHLYILNFILLLFIIGLNRLHKLIDWSIWNILIVVTAIAVFVYMYLAIKKFYKQGRFKTFIKFLLLLLLGFIMIAILFLIFTLLAVFQF
jgi:hypothetical protein